MKKLLLSLLAMCTTAMIGHAEKMAFQAAGAADGDKSSATIICEISGDITGTPTTQEGICSFKISKNGSNTSNVNSGWVRWYSGDEITLTPASDVTINKITIRCGDGKVGEITIGETTKTTTTTSPLAEFENLNATSAITITNSAQIRFSYLEIDYTKAESTICSTPVFNPKDGSNLYEQDVVSISTYTEGAEIYYTINGDDPTTESSLYEAGITFSENGTYTIRAIAVKGGLDNSEVATATFTYATIRPKWDMVTAATTLTDGIYIIAGNKGGVWKALGKDYNNTNKTNFKAIDATVVENQLLEPSADIASIYLRKNSEGNWTLEVTNADATAVAEGANFLTSVTSDNNYLKMTDEQNPATITISETDNTAVIVFTDINARSIRYNDSNNMFSCYTTHGQPVYLFKQPVVKPVTPDATIDGIPVSNEGEINLNGAAKTIKFEGLAEGVNIWYKFTPAIAPQAEYSPEGYSQYDAAEGILLTQAGTLSYYAEKDGVAGDTYTIAVTGTATGISEIEADGVATEWFDLSGRRVAAPAKGVYLRKQGAKVTKIAY